MTSKLSKIALLFFLLFPFSVMAGKKGSGSRTMPSTNTSKSNQTQATDSGDDLTKCQNTCGDDAECFSMCVKSANLRMGGTNMDPNDCRNADRTCASGYACQQNPDNSNGIFECVKVAGGSEETQKQAGSSGDVGTCDLDALYQQCESDFQSAGAACDEKNDSGIASATSTISQLSKVASQASTMATQSACNGVSKAANMANGAYAAFQLYCSSAISSCSSSCAAVIDAYNKGGNCVMYPSAASAYTGATDYVKQCNALNGKNAKSQQSLQSLVQTAMVAQNCSNLASNAPEICKTNASLPICTAALQDCSNPTYAANNKVCICAKNPNDPQCLQTASVNNPSGTSSSADPNARIANKDTNSLLGDLGTTPEVEMGKGPTRGGGSDPGRQGGNGNLSADGGGGAGAGGHGGEGGSDSSSNGGRQVTAGFYGSGGGGGFGSGGSGSSGSGSGGIFSRVVNAFKGDGPDLRQFLPGQKFDPRRGIAGASGPDGMTGPHSNIWQKIQNRYQSVAPTLMP